MKEAEPMFVYGLREPGADVFRYVGATHAPDVRLRHHVRHPHSPALKSWMEEMGDRNLEPEMVILEETTDREIARLEIKWMRSLSEAGHPLLCQVPAVKVRSESSRAQRYPHTWSIRLTARQMGLVKAIADREERDKIDVVRDAIEGWARHKGVLDKPPAAR